MTVILIIEDEASIRQNIAEVLRLENYTVLEAQDGEEGVRLASEYLPDLVICDIMMPKLDGYGVLRHLRSDSHTAILPLIFLTAKSDRMDVRKGMVSGADDYLTKPFTHDDLLGAIRSRLDKQAQLEIHLFRQFALHLVALQESERRSLAQVLNEDLLHLLSALQMQLSIGKTRPSSMIASMLEEVEKITDALIDRVHVLSLELFPTMLEHLGLRPALLWLCEQFTQQTGIQVDWDSAELDINLDLNTRLAVYRVLQEALQNIAIHAQTNHAEVRIEIDEDILHLYIEDQGAGFTVEDALWLEGANGLLMMRERAVSMGGAITIHSSPGEGTRLHLSLPLSRVTTPPQEPHEPVTMPKRLPPTQKSMPQLRSATSQDHIRVLLADKHEITRRGLRVILESQPDIAVVGEVDDGLAVLPLVQQLHPDALVIDLMMPGLSGMDVAREIADHDLQTRVVMLSTQTANAYVAEALRSGASGYVLKDSSGEDLVQAVQQVVAGRRYLSPKLTDQAIDAFASDPYMSEDIPLTKREMEIMYLLVKGHRNAEIADKLSISPRTAETHRANILRKLGLRTQTDLVRYAIQRGLISLEE